MNFLRFTLLWIVSYTSNFLTCEKYLPVLLWHSAGKWFSKCNQVIHNFFKGETCCDKEIITYSELIQTQLGDDVHIKSVQIGSSNRSDRVRSLTVHPFDQVSKKN